MSTKMDHLQEPTLALVLLMTPFIIMEDMMVTIILMTYGPLIYLAAVGIK